MEQEQQATKEKTCECGQCSECRGFFGSKTNGILLLVLIALMIIAIVIMLGDKQKYFPTVKNRTEEVSINAGNTVDCEETNRQYKEMYDESVFIEGVITGKNLSCYSDGTCGIYIDEANFIATNESGRSFCRYEGENGRNEIETVYTLQDPALIGKTVEAYVSKTSDTTFSLRGSVNHYIKFK